MSALISVIVPVYNVEAFLPRCLDSIVEQTYSNLEIICVNDGSTDASGSILDEYASRDTRIKVIHQENAGVSVARNRGLDAASGEYVTFVDGDDSYVEGALEHVSALFAQGNYGMMVTAYLWVEVSGNSLHRGLPASEVCAVRSLQERMIYDSRIMGSVWNKFFKREKIQGIRFDESLTYCEDMHFVSLVLKSSPEMKVLISPVATYEYHANATSAIHDASRMLDCRGNLRYLHALDAILSLYPRDWRMWLLVRSGQFHLLEENIDKFQGNVTVVRRLARAALRMVLPYLACRRRCPLRLRLVRLLHVMRRLFAGR